MIAVEKYYSVQETALLLSVCEATVLRRIKSGDFGAVINLSGPERPDYRLPASGINAWVAARRVFPEPGIAARSVGELRRKSALQPVTV